MKRFIRSNIIKKADDNTIIRKINRFMFKNNLPEAIYTKNSLLKHSQEFIEDAYGENEIQERENIVKRIKENMNNKYYIVPEDGYFDENEGYATINDVINGVIKTYKKYHENEPEMIKQFEENINKIK